MVVEWRRVGWPQGPEAPSHAATRVLGEEGVSKQMKFPGSNRSDLGWSRGSDVACLGDDSPTLSVRVTRRDS